MSLTQKAKKKFFGSLSKRKKLKISEESGDKPPPLPQSRPPIPSFIPPSQAFKESTGYIHASTSLPDQLNRTEVLDTPLYTSKSLLHLQTVKSGSEKFQHQENTNIDSRSKGVSKSSSKVPTIPGCDEACDTVINENSKDLDPAATSTADTLDFRLKQTPQTSSLKNLTLTNTEGKLGQSEGCFKSDTRKTDHREFNFNSRSPPSLSDLLPDNVDSDKFVNSLFSEIIDSYNFPESTSLDDDVKSEDDKNMNDKILLDDAEISDNVFEVEENDLFSDTSTFKNSTGCPEIVVHISTSLNQHKVNFNENYAHQTGNVSTEIMKNSSEVTILTEKTDLPISPILDNSVLTKIRFFESCSDNIKGSVSINNKSAAELIWKQRSFSEQDKNVKNCVHKQSKNLTSTRTTSKLVPKVKLESSHKSARQISKTASLRVFKMPASAGSRLNFSRFRNSRSIPEDVSMCDCGKLYEEECSGCLVNIVDGSDNKHNGSFLKGRNNERVIAFQQVCHHPQCTEDNGGRPLMLCRQCEHDIHKNPDYSGHLVLDNKQKRSQVTVRPPSPSVDYDDESESDTQHSVNEDKVDGLFVKNSFQIRNKNPNTELERKLKRKLALKKKGKNELDAALDQIADPEGYGSIQYFRVDSDGGEQRVIIDMGDSPGLSRQDSFDSPTEELQAGDYGTLMNKIPVRRQSKVSLSDSHFTLKFASSDSGPEESVVVAASSHTTLREAIEASLIRRNIDINAINVFIEKSHTPLPMSSVSDFLTGNILVVKEKDDPDYEPSTQGKSRSSSNKSGTGKGSKQSGRNSRRESVAAVPLLLEPPPTKQRRGSLQLPFREHFFTKGDSKNSDALKVLDDSFGSLRGRTRSGNLSVDDTFYPPTSPGGSWSEAKRGKSPKLSVVNLFTPTNKDKERQDQLTEILNRYSLHGLPPFPELLALGRPKFDDRVFEMESSWKSVVTNNQNMTKKQQEHQEAVWELLLTEVSYIKQIRVIIDVFQNCLMNVQQESFLNEIDTEKLFSNIDKVFECNCMFWQQYLLPVLQRGRECKQPLDPLLSKEGFVDHFYSLFQVYFKYFIEHKSCQDYAKSCMENSDLFKTFIQWAETQKQCNRLKLADILVKPMQRLLKYSLLLQAILKHTENEKDRADIQEMIQSVDKLCCAANNSLRRREDYEKLEAVRRTIEPYDAIEAPNDECAKIIQEHNGNFNLLAPMPGIGDGPRILLFQSSLRMREAQNIKLDVDCLLFTDLILICKPSKRMERFKIIRPPMRLDHLVLRELKDKGSFLLIYMNEYHVPISAFTFQSDVGAIRGWLEKFKKAQSDYKMKIMQETKAFEYLRTETNTGQVEVESSPILSVSSYQELISPTLPRSESTESADRFMPNLLTPSDSTSDVGHIEPACSSSAADLQNRPTSLSGHRDLPHANTEPKLWSPLAAESSFSNRNRTGSDLTEDNSHSIVTKHKPVQSSRSVPNIMVGNGNNGSPTGVTSPPKHGNNLDNSQSFQDIAENAGEHHSSLLSSSQHKDIYHSPSEGSLSEQNSISDEEECAKLKLNSRRVSRTEKRYHTSDAIPDMKASEKDTSIHKRLSWRTDIQSVDHKNLGSKAVSTDSVRSIPSSSGVSSTGSLHLTMENEISEEQEMNSNDSDNYSGGSPIRANHLKLFSLGDNEDNNDDDGTEDCGTLADSKQSKSRSASDLVAMLSDSLQVSQLEDGIASVALTTDEFRRKYTQAELLKMKKLKHQLLYDANIESSEV